MFLVFLLFSVFSNCLHNGYFAGFKFEAAWSESLVSKHGSKTIKAGRLVRSSRYR